MKISAKSTWNEVEITQFLTTEKIPLRLACFDKEGYPLICSLWFNFSHGEIWLAAHQSAYIINILQNNPNVAFEISTNDYPYKGVRGKGTVAISKDIHGVLKNLLARYLGNGNQRLSSWLMSRIDEEYAIKIIPTSITSWDFSHRME